MISRIAARLQLRPPPLAVLQADDKPAGALEHHEEKFGCVISLLDAATAGRTVVIGRESQHCMLHGIGRCHEHAGRRILPEYEVEHEYMVLKPLRLLDREHETPVLACMLVTPVQLSALVALANHNWDDGDAVRIPWAASCQAAFLLPFHESRQLRPRAIVGMTDPVTRQYIDEKLMFFSVPWPMFCEMDDLVAAGALGDLI